MGSARATAGWWKSRRIVWSCACAGLAIAVLAALVPAVANGVTRIQISGTAVGGRFDGVGAISGGGNSPYLIDYPKPAPSALLAYLFTPKDSAAVPIFKGEIGGGGKSNPRAGGG